MDPKETIDKIAQGELYVRDLGYITPIYLKAVLGKEAYFLNRLPANVSVYDLKEQRIDWKKIDRQFDNTNVPSVEMEVKIYEKEMLGCRLIIERVSHQEYRKRLEKATQSAKSRSVGVSDAHKLRCRYNTFITNVAKEVLPF